MIHDLKYQSHVTWDCKYHVIFIPKYRKKIIYGQVKEKIRRILLELAKRKGVKIETGNIGQDHIHMVL